MSMQNMKHMPTSPVICGQIKAKGTRFVNILKDFWFLSPFLTSLKRKLFWSSTACLDIQTTKCCTCHIVDITCKICASEILSSACKLTIHYFIVMFSGLDRCRTFTRIPCKILSFLSFFFALEMLWLDNSVNEAVKCSHWRRRSSAGFYKQQWMEILEIVLFNRRSPFHEMNPGICLFLYT